MTDQALVLNPNLATAWLLSGYLKALLGEHEMAIEHLTRAMRLSPLDPEVFVAHLGLAAAHLFDGRYDEASSWAEKAMRQRPNAAGAARVAAASHALAGRLERAQKAMAHLRQLAPTLRISNLRDVLTLRRPEVMARYVEGLRKAGLPE
jgi:tetratricopeptide (TPR) repeat protein